MTARGVVSVRLGAQERLFLARRGLPMSVQLRHDLALVRALEEAELCRGAGKLLVRDIRQIARLVNDGDD